MASRTKRERERARRKARRNPPPAIAADRVAPWEERVERIVRWIRIGFYSGWTMVIAGKIAYSLWIHCRHIKCW